VTDSHPVRQPKWAPGSVVGTYQLVGELARGGMAEIWLAMQSAAAGIERPVVLKRILTSSEEDPSFLTMFVDEARLAAQLHHPNVVQSYDFVQLEGSYFLVMEYMPGESVARLTRAIVKAQGRVDPGVAVTIVAQAAAGLGYAHALKGRDGRPLHIVHRDVSPQNVLVTYDGQVKVLDFGIAHAAGKLSHTKTGTVKGKVSYMAPEQALGEPVAAGADVFALGVMLFELVTGRRFYEEEEDVQVLRRLMEPTPFPTPLSVALDLPRKLSAIIVKATQREPSLRHPHGLELQAELEEWMKAEGLPRANLAALMHQHFAARIAEREELLAAPLPERREDPSSPSKEVSMPGRTPVSTSTGLKTAAPRRWVPALVAVALLVGGAAGSRALGLWGSAGGVTRLTISSVPEAAEVSVDETPCPAPCTVFLAKGEHAVTASAPGFLPERRQVRAQGGSKELVLVLVLAAAPKEAPRPAPTDAGPAEVVVAPHEERAPVDGGRVEAAHGRGLLSLDTNPWTRVYLGRTLLGETPILEVPVPSGRQRLRLVNDQEKIDTVIEVQVQAGKTTVKKLTL
jgi:serine/threonine protein kinase